MSITLEEARTLETFSQCGSIAKTADKLRKANSAVLYALDSIESKSGLKLFDRSGYRTLLNPAGLKILDACQKLLEAESDFKGVCLELSQGWEVELKIIFEGLFPIQLLFQSVKELSELNVPTRFHLQAEFLGEVEKTFADQNADIMISVLPVHSHSLESLALKEIPALLVAHKKHPLILNSQMNNPNNLEHYPLLTVRGSDTRLQTPTSFLENKSTIRLNDFHSKKIAILQGLGFGWLPTYLVEEELKRGELKMIQWTGLNTHSFFPQLFRKKQKHRGKAAQAIISKLSIESSACSQSSKEE